MIQLINDDALIALTKLEENSVDLTVTSPPYDNLRTYNGNNDQWGEHVWRAVIADLYRVTADGGVVVWVVGDATIKGSETGTSFKQALWAMECGFNLHDTMIWNKSSFTAVGALKTRYAQTFEYMFIFCKGKLKTFNPLKDRKNKKSGKMGGNLRLANGKMKIMSTDGKIRSEYGQRFAIWNQASCGGNTTCHPAPFPIQLATDHILSWSNPGDTVLDPFLGSGTTGVAAASTGRRFIGIEMDADYFAIAAKRIKTAHVQGKLFQ